MDDDKTGLHAKRAPREKEKKVIRSIAFPPAMIKEFEKKAAAKGVSFSRYIVEDCLEPQSDAYAPDNS